VSRCIAKEATRNDDDDNSSFRTLMVAQKTRETGEKPWKKSLFVFLHKK